MTRPAMNREGCSTPLIIAPLIPPHPLPWPLLLRGRDDKTGYEPRGLFNVVEFVMNDKKGNGFITLEEAMQVCGWRSAGFKV